MKAETALRRVRALVGPLRDVGILGLYLFGSVAQGRAGSESDVDVFIDPDYDRFDFGGLLRAESCLEAALGRKVDLVTRESLHPLLRAAIERDAIRVF